MRLQILGLLILCTAVNAFAQTCEDSFLKGSQIQKAIWGLRQQGLTARAESLQTHLEDLLRRDEIESIEVLSQYFEKQGEEVNFSTEGLLLITFKSGIKAVAKSKGGDYENMNAPASEIAAFELSRALGYDNVPTTIKRSINGKQMSLQYFVEGAASGNSQIRYHARSWLFDFLSAYSDLITSRPANKPDNILVLPEEQPVPEQQQVLIDNASTFQTRYDSAKESVAHEWAVLLRALRKSHLTLQDIALSKEDFSRLVSITDSELRAHMAPFLPKKEIDNMLARRKHYIERMRPYVSR